MLEIDGAHGEGGGQILRNAVGLSTILNKPIKVSNIRANRTTPGLKAQHYVVIKSIKEMSNAKTENLEIGSTELTFIPGKFKKGNYKFDIGTAGSITLVFQALILAALKSEKKLEITLTGGTDVKWSPSWDYFFHVFIPIVKKFGLKVDVELIRRGYYPKGGGEAKITIHPGSIIKPLNLTKHVEFSKIKGIVNIGQLSGNISKKIKHSTIRSLLKNNLQSDITIDISKPLSPGTGITIWTDSREVILGSTELGERGVPSEEIGKNVVKNIFSEISSKSTLDIYAFDQILPYMAIAKGTSSCKIRKISNHAQTNMWLIKQFLDSDFQVKQEEENIKISVINQ